jgi:hypothetical protein
VQSNLFTVNGSDTRSTMGWAPYQYRFKASGKSTVLSFASATGTAYGPALDNVSISAVPEPAQWAMMLMGFGGLGVVMRSRRKAVAAA